MGARPVEVLLNTGGNGKLDSMLAYLKRHLELRPDLVVLQGGENDAFDEAFRRNYIALLDFYKPALVIVLGDWWQGEKSEWEKAEAHARAFPFVDLLSLYADKSNSGDGGPYGIDGVAHHPSTNGHKAIAHGIIAAFDRLTNPGEAARVGRFISERDQRNA
jgi:lysophospholipase L1-like esterase